MFARDASFVRSIEIDFLHETNRALERRVHELTELKRNLNEKQFDEHRRHDDVDRHARKTHVDNEHTVELADRELNDVKVR
jgi:hypothetical protein